ncbi:hypothetical protein POJ06DRAFT_253347 [Lipomyces tetrasporus]|uniref:K Homology domain-containing protein n=1 Tax=Lipomyces tetrasporus TaxID=54092 RepID=A0AAD7VSS2_9ASCO|nr:uncharacterized protein POJ06DRAFT_253347 [Lipomyces tetrasporus]KAJ8100658.1 hypothetical protein POJ06DRAFT_253347 [Lipomyces tetrasporus]
MATTAGLKRHTPDDNASIATKRQALSRGAANSSKSVAGNRNGAQSKSSKSNGPSNEALWVSLRCLVSGREAAALIGKNGENITLVRELAAVRCSFSDNIRGAAERIVTITGTVEGVAKACQLLVRTILNEPLDQTAIEPKKHSLRILIPHKAMGPIIGKAGARLREIRESSGTTLTVSETLLPLSNERSLLVHGDADAVQQAALMICQHLLDQSEKLALANVQYYNPLPICGAFGHVNHWHLYVEKNVATPVNPYGVSPNGYSGADYAAQLGIVDVRGDEQALTPEPRSATKESTQRTPIVPTVQAATSVQSAQQQAQQALPGQPMTQQIYIPNDMVGAIIGKGGAKINEIRQLSGSNIKINEPQDNSNERLVTITGTSECNQMALYLLHSRLENEKKR